MQESWARLHGWRRRGRMAGGVSGAGGGLGAEEGGLDEKQLPQDGGVWTGGFGERRSGGPAPTLQFWCAQGQA